MLCCLIEWKARIMFSSDKVLQEIVYLLGLNGGKMNLLKLMKELYLIDREAIAERDTSVSGDIFFSMKHGPVLSLTLNMLNDLNGSEWGEWLESLPAKYYNDIAAKKETEFSLLSEKDKEYISTVSERFRHYTSFQLEDYTHKNLPEWHDPQNSSKKIRYCDIMRALGRSDAEIREAKEEYEFVCGLNDAL